MNFTRLTANGEGNGDLLRRLAFGGSAGAGALLVYAALDVMKSEPKLLIEMVSRWGPQFVIIVVAIYFVDKNFGQMIKLGQANVEAQQKMADAMREIADKDDRAAEESRRMVAYVGTQMDKILERLSPAPDENSKARSASAQ